MPASISDYAVPRPGRAGHGCTNEAEAMTTSHWSASAVAAIATALLSAAPPIAAAARLLPGVDLWDYWPVQDEDGRVAAIAGGTLYFFLAASAIGDPEARHDRATLRLVHRCDGLWRDLGPVFPNGFAPGSRQWSGSAIVDARQQLTLYFTAAGRCGETALGFDQRLFATSAPLTGHAPPAPGAWTTPVEVVAAGGAYMTDMTGGGAIGSIKAFRDPYYFRDPADGAEYLLFAASLAASSSSWNGAVGVARRDDDGWCLAPPLIAADGVNNELERPHVVVHGGCYYCFWSTQAKAFADDGPAGPTGLYGMVADALAGPWHPLNGSGLVVANPAAFPHQAYSWLVLHDLTVISFVDFAGLAVAPADAIDARRHFGGTPAPELRLRLDGDRAVLA